MSKFLVLFALFFSAQLSADTLHAVTEVLPPYQQYDQQQKISGFTVEIVKALATSQGDDLSLSVLPWERAFNKTLVTKNLLLFSMYRIPEREQQFHWLGKVDENIHYFYALRDRPNTHVTSLEQAKNLVIAVTENAFEDKQLTKRGFNKLMKVSSPEQVINMLFSKRVDLLFGSEIAVANLATKAGRSVDDMIRLMTIENWGNGLWMAFNKDSDKALITRYKKAYKELSRNGTIAEIKARHFHFDYIKP